MHMLGTAVGYSQLLPVDLYREAQAAAATEPRELPAPEAVKPGDKTLKAVTITLAALLALVGVAGLIHIA